MNPSITKTSTTSITADAALAHVSPCPYGAIADAADRVRGSIHRTRPNDHGALTKRVRAATDAIASEFRQAIVTESLTSIRRLGDEFERQTLDHVLRFGGLSGRIAAAEALVQGARSSAEELDHHERSALSRRNTALEQAEAVAGEAARRRRTWLRRAIDFVLRRGPNSLCRRQIDHLERAAIAGVEAARFETAAHAARALDAHAMKFVGTLRAMADSADRAHDVGERRLKHTGTASLHVSQPFPPPEERLAFGESLCAREGRVASVARRAVQRHMKDSGELSQFIREEAEREAQNAPLPSTLTEYLHGLDLSHRVRHFDSLATAAKAALPVQWWEMPLTERLHWVFLALPGGKGSPFYNELAGANPEKTPTFDIDNSGTCPDQVCVIDAEVGLHPAQVPFLVDLRRRTSPQAIEKASLWDGPAPTEDVDYELQAQELDGTDVAWKRFSIGWALGLIQQDSGGWCRTTNLPELNGLAQRRLAQGVDAAITTLRSGQVALGVEAAIKERMGALGADKTIEAFDAFSRSELPIEFAARISAILATERSRLA